MGDYLDLWETFPYAGEKAALGAATLYFEALATDDAGHTEVTVEVR